MHSEKIAFLKLNMDSISANENIIWIKMFLNPIHIVKIKKEVIEISYTRSLPFDDLNLELNTLQVGM